METITKINDTEVEIAEAQPDIIFKRDIETQEGIVDGIKESIVNFTNQITNLQENLSKEQSRLLDMQGKIISKSKKAENDMIIEEILLKDEVIEE